MNPLTLKQKIILGLVALCLMIIFTIAGRWLLVIPKSIDTVRIDIDTTSEAHPLDEVLQKHLPQLVASSQLTKQFAVAEREYELDPLWVDQCEVTQRDFSKYRQWSALQTRPQIVHPLQPTDLELLSNTAGHQLLGRLSMPVGGVSAFEAYAYCAGAGGRLPTSAEFLAIASGANQHLYPWGNTISAEQLNAGWPYRDPALNVQACGVASHLENEQGVYDLGNNLMEWTLDGINEAYLMGGNAFNRPVAIQAINLIKRPAALDYRSQYSGFRCVYPRPTNLGNVNHQTPWGSQSDLIAIDGGNIRIGPPQDALIPKMLSLLEEQQYKQLEQLPLTIEPVSGRVTRHEIRVETYANFLSDPLVKLGFFDHPKQPSEHHHKPHDWRQQSQNPQHPITNISWWSAYATAKWLGGQLMTNRQWKSIAGASQTLYPWGNDYVVGRSIDRHHPGNKWQPRNTQLSDDASASGVTGMAGNVAEWTSSVVHFGSEFHVIIKGGSFNLPYQANQVSQTASASPNYRNPDLGFRVIFPDKMNNY